MTSGSPALAAPSAETAARRPMARPGFVWARIGVWSAVFLLSLTLSGAVDLPVESLYSAEDGASLRADADLGFGLGLVLVVLGLAACAVAAREPGAALRTAVAAVVAAVGGVLLGTLLVRGAEILAATPLQVGGSVMDASAVREPIALAFVASVVGAGVLLAWPGSHGRAFLRAAGATCLLWGLALVPFALGVHADADALRSAAETRPRPELPAPALVLVLLASAAAAAFRHRRR